MKQILTIATRASALALWQAEHIKSRIEELFDEVEVKLNVITARGDKILDRPLALIGGKGHFTKELEDEMLAGNADMAVHSLKDVPTYMPKGLELSAVTKRANQDDVLLSHRYSGLEALPKGATVGTTSLRRRMQLLQKRPDLCVVDLRGNVNTRLRKLKEGEYDAILLARIGLERLDLLKDIPYVESMDFIPPMGQASLGIEIVSDNALAREVSKALNDEQSYICALIEREFVAAIEAGCSAPVAINAKIVDQTVELRAMIGFSDGSRIMSKEQSFSLDAYKGAGKRLAEEMIAKGALELLKEAEAVAFKETEAQRI